jgi:hypothetical protein
MKQPLDMEQVLAAELKVIRDRRVYLKFGRLPDSPSTGPSAEAAREEALEMGLTGLAFSGGGIRSATFALGILQGLARLGLLSRFDYLSTVSGGGYIGSWLAAWVYREGDLANVERQLKPSRAEQAKAERELLRPARQFHPMPDRPLGNGAPAYFQRGRVVDEEPEPIHHIRSYSNYLAPRPGLTSADTWALLAIYLRNVAINSMTILPATIILVAIVRLVVAYFAQSPRNLDWLLGINAFGALVNLVLSVRYIVLALKEVARLREHPAGPDGRGPEAPRPHSNKAGLHCFVILPLFLSAICFTWMFYYPVGFDLQLMSWGDGSGVRTTGKSLVILGVDTAGRLHIRIFDAGGKRVTDTDEAQLPGAQAGAVAALKQQLPGLLPRTC